jgi:hypothetical protein
MINGWAIALGLAGLSNLGNGLWMLVDPAHWYLNLPARVPDFGPLNEHFVRDVGCAFSVVGVLLLVAIVRPAWRLAACAVAAGFYGLHALVHVIDTTRGLVGPEHWGVDLPAVYLPVALYVALVALAARRTA